MLENEETRRYFQFHRARNFVLPWQYTKRRRRLCLRERLGEETGMQRMEAEKITILSGIDYSQHSKKRRRMISAKMVRENKASFPLALFH